MELKNNEIKLLKYVQSYVSANGYGPYLYDFYEDLGYKPTSPTLIKILYKLINLRFLTKDHKLTNEGLEACGLPHYYSCSIEGCDEKRIGKGLCWKHYQRQNRYGNPYLVQVRGEKSGEWEFVQKK